MTHAHRTGPPSDRPLGKRARRRAMAARARRSDDATGTVAESLPAVTAPPPSAQAPPEPGARTVVTLSAWANVRPEPRRWLWPEWIPRGTTTVLYGDGGTGKSLLAQQLATACATGAPFLGQPVEACPAFCLFCEDDGAELLRRQVAVNTALGVEMAALDRMHVVPASGEDNLLMVYDRRGMGQATPFGALFQAMAAAADPGLIVVDTVADTFGGNEVTRSDVRQFISWLNGLAARTDAAVLMLAHPSLLGMSSGRGASGSTAWTNGARSHLYLSRPLDEAAGAPVSREQADRVLARKKANYAARGAELGIVWREGAFVPAEAPKPGGRRLTPVQETALRALKLALEVQPLPSPGWPVPADVDVTPVTVWRSAFAQHGDFPENVTRSAFRTAWMRAHQGLVGKGIARIWGDVAWLVEAEA